MECACYSRWAGRARVSIERDRLRRDGRQSGQTGTQRQHGRTKKARTRGDTSGRNVKARTMGWIQRGAPTVGATACGDGSSLAFGASCGHSYGGPYRSSCYPRKAPSEVVSGEILADLSLAEKAKGNTTCGHSATSNPTLPPPHESAAVAETAEIRPFCVWEAGSRSPASDG